MPLIFNAPVQQFVAVKPLVGNAFTSPWAVTIKVGNTDQSEDTRLRGRLFVFRDKVSTEIADYHYYTMLEVRQQKAAIILNYAAVTGDVIVFVPFYDFPTCEIRVGKTGFT